MIGENVLSESDNVLSAIRIVDLFTVQIQTVKAEPTTQVERIVQMRLVILSRFPPDDTFTHAFTIHLIRPNNESQALGEAFMVKPVSSEQIPGHPKGVNLIVTVGVNPRTMGLHYIRINIDGKEISRIPFTLREVPAPIHVAEGR